MNGKLPNFNASRRQLIQYGGSFIGTSLIATLLGAKFNNSQPAAAQDISEEWLAQNKDLTPDMALEKLLAGNKRFVERRSENPNQDFARLSAIAESQAPFASILGCADSRVPSEIIFDQGFGDLFVCRVAGNIATPEEIGSLEFGAMILGTKLIMVVGHERCGAVTATLEGGRFPGQIGSLVEGIQVGVERAEKQPGTDKLEKAVKSNVLYQVERLGRSTVLGDLVDKGQLKIVGAYYDLDTSQVTLVS